VAAAAAHVTASAALAGLDPVMAELYRTHGPARLGVRPRVDERFSRLASSIVSQQLAGAAAATIWSRVLVALGGRCTPGAVLAAPPEVLRGAGLSGAKEAAVRDLAERVADGRLDLVTIGRAPDDDVERRLVQVRGIGPWTAHMFLIFGLHRPDVWPTGDLGVRNGYRIAQGLTSSPTPAELEELGERYRPWRSYAAWYLWRAADA
jgi:3-methyladenine DNA glycosylase/8-oxoguanine DNA glycosylase